MMTTGKYLIEEPQFEFLRRLGLERTNFGVYTKRWNANGKVGFILFNDNKLN